jgi:molybdopterin biosynthesis enzyme
MTSANGYVVVAENQEGLAEGETVDAYMFGSPEGDGKNV